MVERAFGLFETKDDRKTFFQTARRAVLRSLQTDEMAWVKKKSTVHRSTQRYTSREFLQKYFSAASRPLPVKYSLTILNPSP